MITFVNIIYQSQKLRRCKQRIDILLKTIKIFKDLLDFIQFLR